MNIQKSQSVTVGPYIPLHILYILTDNLSIK